MDKEFLVIYFIIHMFIIFCSIGFYVEPTLIQTINPNSKLLSEVIFFFGYLYYLKYYYKYYKYLL